MSLLEVVTPTVEILDDESNIGTTCQETQRGVSHRDPDNGASPRQGLIMRFPIMSCLVMSFLMVEPNPFPLANKYTSEELCSPKK